MEKILPAILFRDFAKRDEGLKKIKRYASYPMFYRTDDYVHSWRVLWHIQSLIPFAEKAFGNSFDSTKAQILAFTHDDSEIVLGDIEAGYKQKMSSLETADLEKRELVAIDTVAGLFPRNIGPYNYRDIQLEYFHAETKEARLAKLVDKFDAFGEALHEIFAGNIAFTKTIIHSKYGHISLPTDFYREYIGNYFDLYPDMYPLKQFSHVLFRKPEYIDIEATATKSEPHSPAGIKNIYGYEPYDVWRETILNNAPEDQAALLCINSLSPAKTIS